MPNGSPDPDRHELTQRVLDSYEAVSDAAFGLMLDNIEKGRTPPKYQLHEALRDALRQCTADVIALAKDLRLDTESLTRKRKIGFQPPE